MVINCEEPYRLSESVYHLCEDIREEDDGMKIKMAAPLFHAPRGRSGEPQKMAPF